MSYVIGIWEQPASMPLPASYDEALRVLRELRRSNPGRNPKFEQLARRLNEGYPGMIRESDGFDESDPAAEDHFLANLPWHGETPDGDCEEAVYNLGLTTALLEKERPFAVAAATAIGLCVIDEQSGEVFLPDCRRLTFQNTPAPSAPSGNSATPRPDIYRSPGSHLLQVWEQPANTPYPASFREVVGLVDQLRETHPGPNPKFLIIAQRLQHTFPAAAGSSVWNGPAPDGKSGCGVLDLDASAAHVAEVRSAVLRHARQLGLSMLDELAVDAHLGDGNVLSLPSSRVSPQERFATLSLLAVRNNPRAQAALGADYEQGHGVRQNYETAMNWYRLAARQGVKEAQNALGLMYKRGHGASQDYPEAAHWIRLAAEQGLPEAQANLGDMYQYGQGVAKDAAEAAKWFRAAADQGNAHAACALGFLHMNSQGVPEDKKRAIELFRLAARKSNTLALMNLGDAYDRGNGVVKNRIVARVLFSLGSAASGTPGRLPNGQRFSELPSADVEAARQLELAWAGKPDVVAAIDDYLAQNTARRAAPVGLDDASRGIGSGRMAVLFAALLFGIDFLLPPPARVIVYGIGVVVGLFGVARIVRGMEAGNASQGLYSVAMLIPWVNIAACLYLTLLASNALAEATVDTSS